MTTFKELVKMGDTLICDHCKKDILAKEIKLQDPIDNFEILTPMMSFKFIDKDGKITGGYKQAQKDLGDKVFGCPHCDTTHLYGFNLKN
jgi:transcription elongation factor Elf1